MPFGKTDQYCESCMMPFSKDPGKRESTKYCSYCFKNGDFIYKGNSLKEFQKLAYEGMRENGMNFFTAKLFTFMIGFAPRWKNKE